MERAAFLPKRNAQIETNTNNATPIIVPYFSMARQWQAIASRYSSHVSNLKGSVGTVQQFSYWNEPS
jgi:hypothetical protein